MPPDSGLTMSELAALTDVSVRTIRYYIAKGLLPAPGREGPSTRYDDAFVARLRLIKQLRAANLPLAEIRSRLADLSDDEIAALTETPTPEPPDSALDYVRTLLAGPDAAWPEFALQGTAWEMPDLEPDERPSLQKRAAALPSWGARPQASEAPPAPMLRRTSPMRPPAEAKPPTPERSHWERIVLEPDVELHVRRPLTRHQNKRVERLIAFARELQEGDKP